MTDKNRQTLTFEKDNNFYESSNNVSPAFVT